jgi:ribosomal protein S18 acetylase RimI-like enzyme
MQMKNMCSLLLSDSIDPNLEILLYKGLDTEAHLLRHMPPIQPFSIELKSAEQQINGGATGVSLYGNLYVDMLWVAPDLRGQGWGTKIMRQAEEIGRRRKCSFATVNTMDWQALPFYQKLGYAIEFTRDGFENGAKMLFLRKPL